MRQGKALSQMRQGEALANSFLVGWCKALSPWAWDMLALLEL
jgi:hypothetical protein